MVDIEVILYSAKIYINALPTKGTVSMKNIPAFPNNRDRQDGQPGTINEEGMTLRDYLAGQALAGFTVDYCMESAEKIAEWAYQQADAMLKEREKEPK